MPRDERTAKLRRAIELAEQLARSFLISCITSSVLTQNYGNLGRLLMPAQLEEAEKLMRLSLLLAEEMGDQVLLAAACCDIGGLMMNKANPEAEQWLRRAVADLGETGNPVVVAPWKWSPAPCQTGRFPGLRREASRSRRSLIAEAWTFGWD